MVFPQVVGVGDDSDMTAEEFTNAHPALAEFWHPVALSCEVELGARGGPAGWPGLGAGASRR